MQANVPPSSSRTGACSTVSRSVAKNRLITTCSTPIAGLDPAAFNDPETVDFARPEAGKHVGFGAGIHICPGAYLARLELRVMLEELLPRLPGLHIPVGARVEASSGGTLSLTTLPLAWKI